MARIAATSGEKIFQLKAFAGLHQNPDGDTKLKFGEAAKMRNFAVTRDGTLRKRPGTKAIFSLGESPIAGMWTGFVSGREVLLAACGGKLWSLWNSETEEFEQQEAGSINTEGKVHFFGFGGIVYILDGVEYRQWDGENLQNVHGYRPLVQVSTPPEGGGETLENVNRLCGERRIWISPDGEAAAFALPEKGLESIDGVKSVPGGEIVEGYTADLETGIVTFANVPEKGVNSYEIAYSIANPFRSQVTDMRFSELYNDTQDSRIFPVSKHYLHREMERGCKQTGVKRIRIHDIRHSHISLLIDMGFSALTIAERVGHESIDITYRYAHLFPTRQTEMADKLDMKRKGA